MEYECLYQEFGWDEKFFKELNLKNIDHIFGEEELKDNLRKKIFEFN